LIELLQTEATSTQLEKTSRVLEAADGGSGGMA